MPKLYYLKGTAKNAYFLADSIGQVIDEITINVHDYLYPDSVVARITGSNDNETERSLFITLVESGRNEVSHLKINYLGTPKNVSLK